MTKVFNKRNAKRVTAILLAVIAVVSSILIIPANAAGKEVTITFDYCYDTGDNIITFVKYTEHGGYTVGTVGEELCRIYADGKDAYCLEPGHSLYSGNTLTTDASAAWNALSKAQKKAINLALLFGKSGNSSGLVGTDGQKWIATQLVVWEFCTGCRDASTFKLSNSKFIDGITAGDHNPNVKTNYNKIIAKLNSYNVIPSFSYDTQAKAKSNVKELKYSDGKYSLIRGNVKTTKVDADYPDNKLTGAVFEIYSDTNADGKLDKDDKLLGEIKETDTGIYEMDDLVYGHYLVKEKKAPDGFVLDENTYPVFIETDGKTYDVENDAGKGFLNEAMKGSLKIVKTSSDNKVEGISFRVTGENGYLPKTVAKMVLQRIKDIQEIKELLGDEYHDYNLLFSSSTGRPMEGQVITRSLKKLISDHDLPDVCFHSLRHSSITYKLKWSGGDIKSVQGDSGHARADMVTEQYSHILDEDRVANARRVDEQVYNQPPQKTQADNTTDMNPTELLGQIFSNPEMGKAFQAFLQQYQSNS